MVSDRQYLYNLPFEVLSAILSAVVGVGPFQSTQRSAFLDASRDLLNITHINSHVRRVAICNPHLWTMIPFINDVHEDYLQTMIARSSPLPFCLSFVEDESLPLLSSVWEPVMSSKERIGFLRAEVEEDYGGTITKALLTAKAPGLRKCAVKFYGQSSVVLPLDGTRYGLLFDGHAPQLQALDLTNCYISSPEMRYPDSFTSLSIQFLGTSPTHSHSILHELHLLNVQFRFVCSLELSNCFLPADREHFTSLELPSLRQLVLSAPYAICETLAHCLNFPDTASRQINVLFPTAVSPHEARLAVLAAASFIGQDVAFVNVQLSLERQKPTIVLRRASGGDMGVTFHLCETTITTAGLIKYMLHVLNTLSVSRQALTPIDPFSFRLWKAFALVLKHRVTDATKLDIILPRNHSPAALQYLQPILRGLPDGLLVRRLKI